MKQAFVRSFVLSALVFTAAMLLPSMLMAQELVVVPASEVVTAAPVAAVVAPVAVSGPRVSQVGISRSAVVSTDMPQQPYRGSRSDIAWMTVGGVALVAGLIIGGDVGTLFAVSGAVIGLVGLYRYMN